MKIAKNTIVALRYKMKDSKGEVLEDITASAPVNYLHGSGSILPALEANLVGLKTGEKKRIHISKEQEELNIDDDFHFEVIIDDVRMATKEELMAGGPKDQDQTTGNCGPDCCC